LVEYYQTQYNLTIKDKNQPLLVAVPSNFERKQKTKKTLLVPELCFMTGLTSSMQRDFKARQMLIRKTQLDPKTRVERYHAFLNKLDTTEQVRSELSKWKIEYGNQLLRVDGVRMVGEKLTLAKPSVR